MDVDPVQAIVTIDYKLGDGEITSLDHNVEILPPYDTEFKSKIPSITLDMTVMDWVMAFEERVRSIMDAKTQGKDRRKNLVLFIVREFQKHLLEYDDETYSQAVFYMEVPVPGSNEMASAIVYMSFFESEPPKIFLASPVATRSNGNPVSKDVTIRLDITMPPESIAGRI
ncbi:hypothetical protein HDU76_012114, partial [Blyttiomyces sp. JEL0837]